MTAIIRILPNLNVNAGILSNYYNLRIITRLKTICGTKTDAIRQYADEILPSEPGVLQPKTLPIHWIPTFYYRHSNLSLRHAVR